MKLLISGYTSQISQELIKKINSKIKVKIFLVGRHNNSDYYCDFAEYSSIRNFIKNVIDKEQFSKKGFIQGFMIAFLNPKILVLLVDVFSQFIKSDINSLDRFIIAIMASFIDMGWYVLVSLLLAGTPLINRFRANALLIDRSIGSILILISLLLINQTIS